VSTGAREDMLRKSFVLLTMVLALAGGVVSASPVPGADIAGEAIVQTAPVRIDGAVLFMVRGVTTYPAKERPAAKARGIVIK
jgi:hypothetical protein